MINPNYYLTDFSALIVLRRNNNVTSARIVFDSAFKIVVDIAIEPADPAKLQSIPSTQEGLSKLWNFIQSGN